MKSDADASGPPTAKDNAQCVATHDQHVVSSSVPFIVCLTILGGSYVVIILLLILGNLGYLFFSEKGIPAFVEALGSADVRYATWLSLTSCTITMVLSLFVSVPIGYLMSRFSYPGKAFIDAILDIPIVLPPLVVGISLLILFNVPPFNYLSDWIVWEIPAVIIAQFMVACAFAVRTMRVTFDQISKRYEEVAMTLGASRGQAFWMIILPQTRHGLLAAATLAWARALGEFGPILVFAGATRQRTEVLPTTVFLEMQAGRLESMLAVSIIMIVLAGIVLVLARLFGMRRMYA